MQCGYAIFRVFLITLEDYVRRMSTTIIRHERILWVYLWCSAKKSEMAGTNKTQIGSELENLETRYINQWFYKQPGI